MALHAAMEVIACDDIRRASVAMLWLARGVEVNQTEASHCVMGSTGGSSVP